MIFRFNKYVEDKLNTCEKDAKDFIKSCAICNKETVYII